MTSESATKLKVLVMHALRPSSRQTTIDHLESFSIHLPNSDVQYLHFQQPIPKEFTNVSPDLFIVNYDFLNYRFTPLWPYIKNRHRDIARRSGKVVAIAQDDFWANKLLDNWCMSWDIDRILTPIDNDLDVLYPRSFKSKEFRIALTGYVKSGPIPSTSLLSERVIDLGQRVREMPPHLGRLAQAKARQAVVLADAAKLAGFTVDVSTRVEDAFIGSAWFEFLSSCRFTVGMKGGASLHDPYGLTHTRVQAFIARHPEATFDEIEKKCFKGKDMKHEFTAISPRLFEAATAGTCQILERDDYLGVLEPWRDYIPLNRDFSNIDEVLDTMRDLDRCQEIVQNASAALLDSKMFDYSRLVHSSCEGLQDSRGINAHGWANLSEFLRFSQAAEIISPEIHDAALHGLEQVARKSNQIAPEVSLVRQVMSQCGLDSWYASMYEYSKKDRIGMRAPWIWRSVINRETEVNV
jgi:hypothetical protein